MKNGMPQILGLGYKMGVGKDTVADYLVKTAGFTKLRFADALKEAVSIIFGWPREDLEDQKFKATEDGFWGISPRTALQLVGTEAMRNNIRQDIWIKALERRISIIAASSSDAKIVIPDMRFLNEVEAVLSWGGSTVEIKRRTENITGTATKHASETELDSYNNWDFIILNNDSFEKLYDMVDWVYQHSLVASSAGDKSPQIPE